MSLGIEQKNARRFKTNPIEILILSAISLVFLNSVYNLFYGHQGVKMTTVTPPTSKPAQLGTLGSAGGPSDGRSPASILSAMPGYANVDVQCDHAVDQPTTASKIRLAGELCGVPAVQDGNELATATIVNQANKFNATVFAHGGNYSTDYIPLNSGKNPIKIEFLYRGGKKHTQELVVNRE